MSFTAFKEGDLWIKGRRLGERDGEAECGGWWGRLQGKQQSRVMIQKRGLGWNAEPGGPGREGEGFVESGRGAREKVGKACGEAGNQKAYVQEALQCHESLDR
jgi:hypothetical protein